MISRPSTFSKSRKSTARAWPLVLLVVAVIAAVAGGTALVLRDRAQIDPSSAATTTRDADAEMAELQTQFKVYSENQQDFNNLLPEVKDFTNQFPGRADGYILLGQVMMKLERWQDALEPLSRALEINPDFPQLQKLAGQCAAKLGYWDRAEDHLTRAISMKPDGEVHMMLGNVYFNTDRLDLAEEQYLLAIDRGRTQSPPHLAYGGLADLYSERGQTAQALEYIDEAVFWADAVAEVDPATYRLQKVRLLLDAGRTDDAAALLKVVSQEEPQVTSTLPYARIQARLWADGGQIENIPGLYMLIYDEQVTAPDPDRYLLAELLADLAGWRIELGQYDRARQTIRDLRALSPKHPMLQELEEKARSASSE